jgi:hypothetical protein
MFETENPTRIWDTFAEPNNKTIPSEALSQNQASPRLVGASTKNQVNGRRLRRKGSSKLVMMRFRNTSLNPVGFFSPHPRPLSEAERGGVDFWIGLQLFVV